MRIQEQGRAEYKTETKKNKPHPSSILEHLIATLNQHPVISAPGMLGSVKKILERRGTGENK